MAIIGGDTETVEGEPLSIQFHSKELGIDFISLVDGKNVFQRLISFLNTLKADGSTYVIYCHNLSFDMVSFFYPKQAELLKGKFTFNYQSWTVNGLYGAVCYAHFSHSSQKRTVYLIDTGKFFMGSLAKLASIFCPDIPKGKPPKGLGKKRFELTDKKFVSYAMRDAEICYRLGLEIQALHNRFDVRQSVSAPQFAARIFKHHFLKKEIPLCPSKILWSALNSYHGGKNNITATGFFKDITCLDIVSAYPFAMSTLPSFSDPSLFRAGKARGNVEVPPLGVYQVNGTVKPCKWPILYSHDFKPLSGRVEKVWITGYEINEALRARELDINSLFGYYYDGEADKNPSPFKSYVEHFFKEKENAKTAIERYFNKILLNSLYGKFIQKHQLISDLKGMWDIDSGKLLEPETGVYVAGGLFNPFIATLITGHTRAFIHRLEHKFKALHTSTDGIITTAPVKKVKGGLGGLKIEFQGDVLILRNKLYLAYHKGDGIPSILFKGQSIGKYALHGFHSDATELERMLKEGRKNYSHVRMNKLKESKRLNLKVNAFEERQAKLIIDYPTLRG